MKNNIKILFNHSGKNNMFEKGNNYGKRNRKISDHKKRRLHLNLLVEIFGIGRQAIKNECCKKEIDLSNEYQVSVYIKNKLKGQTK